jgi:hypothetical protein
MHHYALLEKCASIHFPSQLGFKNDLNYKLAHVPDGLQLLTALDGYFIPLIISHGLACLDIWPHIDHEYETPPCIFLTSEFEWDPSVLNHEFTDKSQWGDDNPAFDNLLSDSLYDELGQYRHRVEVKNHV